MTASRGGPRTSRAAADSCVSEESVRVSPRGLLRAAHGGPTVAVTTLVAVLAAGHGVGLSTGVLLAALFALFEAWLGIVLAYHTDWPTSFWITALSALVYGASLLRRH